MEMHGAVLAFLALLARLVALSCEIVFVLVSTCIRKRAREPTRSGKLSVSYGAAVAIRFSWQRHRETAFSAHQSYGASAHVSICRLFSGRAYGARNVATWPADLGCSMEMPEEPLGPWRIAQVRLMYPGADASLKDWQRQSIRVSTVRM